MSRAGHAAPKGRVVFEALHLQGFGLHRDLRLSLPAGLGVWSAQNERGKTTAVLGLAATLWGVPHRSDPAVPGWGRYRSWYGGPHRGTLTLQAPDGRRYTVEHERVTVAVVAAQAHAVRLERSLDRVAAPIRRAQRQRSPVRAAVPRAVAAPAWNRGIAAVRHAPQRRGQAQHSRGLAALVLGRPHPEAGRQRELEVSMQAETLQLQGLEGDATLRHGLT